MAGNEETRKEANAVYFCDRKWRVLADSCSWELQEFVAYIPDRGKNKGQECSRWATRGYHSTIEGCFRRFLDELPKAYLGTDMETLVAAIKGTREYMTELLAGFESSHFGYRERRAAEKAEEKRVGRKKSAPPVVEEEEL